MTTPLAESVAGQVRAELGRAQFTAVKLAAALGVSHAYLSRRLNGHVPFDVSDLDRIASALGVPVHTFLPAPEVTR